METVPEIKIPYDELKSLVIDSIKEHGNSFEFKNLCNTIGNKVVKRGIVKSPYPDNFQAIYFPL